MAVGRISGPLLKSNLVRNGIDLAFETDLLYLDVNNSRLGVKTNSPQYEMDVNGTTKTTNLIATTATISDINFENNTISTTGNYLNLGTLDDVIYQNKLSIDSIDIEGNTITTNNSNANLEFRPNGTGKVHIHSDLNVDGSVHVTGNITADGNITLGDADTDSITINSEIASDLIPDVTDTYSLGNISKRWNNAWINNLTSTEANFGDVQIRDNYITTSASNASLELRASGTGSVVVDSISINGSTITSATDLTLQPGTGNDVVLNSTGALRLPTGTTAQRPTAATGKTRYNTDLNTFEGYDGTNWIVLSGVQDLDGDTKITAELTPGANDNTIRFNVAGSTVADITATRLNAPKVTVDNLVIDGNTISSATNTNVEIAPAGTGKTLFNNTISIKDNVIKNEVTDSITQFAVTGTGYVKFSGTSGLVIPSGTSLERPPFVNSETGMMRLNTAEQRVEIFDGTSWVSVAGSASGITTADAEAIALELVLSLG